MEFETAILPNGHVGDDLGQGPADSAAPETAHVEPAAEAAPRGLYLVRIPKQPMDDTLLKKHQAEFQAHVAKLKEMNGNLQAKREVVRNLRAQMGDARGLKENSQPEFDDKFGRMKELRELRTQYVNRIKAIRENVKGVDCKNEQEIDDKIRQMEYSISHEGMPLREEKQMLQQIARLNAQRPKVREFAGQEAELKELESEADKIKAILGDMDGEFNVIKTERDATNRVVKDISENLKKAKEELDSLVAEHAELVERKENILKAMDGSRDETNATMKDYRENRKFSLTVRDLVAAGQNDDAAAMVRVQVDEWVAKLSSDPVYWAEYQKLSAANRKFPVSELLPQSSTAVQDPYTANGAGRGGGRGAAGARAPPPEPQGAAKAKLLIEKLMKEASEGAAKARAAAVINGHSDGDADVDDDDAPAVAAPTKKAVEVKTPNVIGGITSASNSTGSAKLVRDAGAAAAAAFNYKVELPKVTEAEAFVAPVIKSDVEVQTKEMLREEQARKNQEAEERKRKRAETAERKKVQAAESAKRLEAERKERDQAARAEAAKAKAAAASGSSRAVEAPAEEALDETAAAPSVQQQQVTKMSAPTPFEKRQQVAAAKRFKPKNTPVKQAQTFWNQYQGWIVLLVVMLLCIILGAAFLM